MREYKSNFNDTNWNLLKNTMGTRPFGWVPIHSPDAVASGLCQVTVILAGYIGSAPWGFPFCPDSVAFIVRRRMELHWVPIYRTFSLLPVGFSAFLLLWVPALLHACPFGPRFVALSSLCKRPFIARLMNQRYKRLSTHRKFFSFFIFTLN